MVVKRGLKTLLNYLKSTYLFHEVPSKALLAQWAASEWPDYQAYIFHNDYISPKKWQSLRKQALSLSNPPLISIVVPVYAPPIHDFIECLLSVKYQTYPFWELCIVDDGSPQRIISSFLRQSARQDSRIRVEFSKTNRGISRTTNKAIKMCKGEYICFLDHDDRLAVDALSQMAEVIVEKPFIDIIYSDSDMISPSGRRFMHMLKPNWSPELLLAFNYITHFKLFHRRIIEQLGGVRPEFEGSQDYDFILRASELTTAIHHVEKILYHWRQSSRSISLNYDSKEYVWASGINALRDTLKRRSLVGDVSEIPDLWRGNFRVRLHPPGKQAFHIIDLNSEAPGAAYSSELLARTEKMPGSEYIVVLGLGITPDNDTVVSELVSWLQIDGVGMATGKIIDPENRIEHAGFIHKPDGRPFSIYEGFDKKTEGYLASASVTRNVGSVHPGCFAIRRELWEEVKKSLEAYQGPYSIFDISFQILQKGFRIVYTPFAAFHSTGTGSKPEEWPSEDRKFFTKKWQKHLSNGDPYYHSHLSCNQVNMGLELPETGFLKRVCRKIIFYSAFGPGKIDFAARIKPAFSKFRENKFLNR